MDNNSSTHKPGNRSVVRVTNNGKKHKQQPGTAQGNSVHRDIHKRPTEVATNREWTIPVSPEQPDNKNKLHELEEKKKEEKEKSERIGAIFLMQKKMFKRKEALSGFKEPVLFLTRNSGNIEIYHGVKGDKFEVPDLEPGQEKHIHLGTKWQTRMPYAGQEFRMYWCHEDYAYPHTWSKPNIYVGKIPQAIKDWVSKEDFANERIPILLENANINSEAARDRERKILIAWERFKAKNDAQTWMAIGKMLLYIGLAIAAVVLAYKLFGGGTAKNIAQTAINVTNSTPAPTNTVTFG